MSAVSIAASGLDAATLQLDVAASNLANSQTRGALAPDPLGGIPLSAGSLGAGSLGAGSPAAGASASSPASSAALTSSAPAQGRAAQPSAYQPLQLVQYSNADLVGGGVSASVRATTPAAYAAYSPSSSYANANGQVATPAVDLPAQIANQASALIQFQANLKVIQTSDQMQKSVIDQTA